MASLVPRPQSSPTDPASSLPTTLGRQNRPLAIPETDNSTAERILSCNPSPPVSPQLQLAAVIQTPSSLISLLSPSSCLVQIVLLMSRPTTVQVRTCLKLTSEESIPTFHPFPPNHERRL
ncbi:hypothetical protein V2G26_019294 [Clonostachys chloroleuca]